MIKRIINWLKSLFEKEKSHEQKWLEKKVADNKKKLKEIENEKHDIDSIVDHFNK